MFEKPSLKRLLIDVVMDSGMIEHHHRGLTGRGRTGDASEAKFAIVWETARLNAAERAEYCRRKGLYPEQIAAWRASCAAANANAAEQAREQRQQGKEDKQRIKQLEKE